MAVIRRLTVFSYPNKTTKRFISSISPNFRDHQCSNTSFDQRRWSLESIMDVYKIDIHNEGWKNNVNLAYNGKYWTFKMLSEVTLSKEYKNIAITSSLLHFCRPESFDSKPHKKNQYDRQF